MATVENNLRDEVQRLKDENAKLRSENERLKSKPKTGRPRIDDVTRTQVLSALLQGQSYRATAKAAGVSDSTVRRIVRAMSEDETKRHLRAEIRRLEAPIVGARVMSEETWEGILAGGAAGRSHREIADQWNVSASTVAHTLKRAQFMTVENLKIRLARLKSPTGTTIDDATREAILADLATGLIQEEVAARHGVSTSSVQKIVEAQPRDDRHPA